MALDIMGKAHAYQSALGDACRERGLRPEADEAIGLTVDELSPLVGLRHACTLTGRGRASPYRDAQGPMHGLPAPRCLPPNKLSDAEFNAVLELLCSPEFVDLAPAPVWARHVCSAQRAL